MSLLFIEGFDAYGSNTFTEAGNGVAVERFGALIDPVLVSSQYVNAGGCFATANTRSGVGSSLGVDAGSGGGGGWKRAFPTRAHIILGFAVYTGPQNYSELMRLVYDNLLGQITTQLTFMINDVAGISVVAGFNTLVANSDPNIIFPRSWNYVEIEVVAGMLGSVTVRLNGAVVIAATGIRTIDIGWPPYYNILHSFWAGSVRKFIDDMYLCDNAGSAFNAFLGDVVVHSVFPASDAGPNDMTQVGTGASHFNAVNGIGVDEDATYLTTNASAVEERFTVSTLPADIIDVLAVCVHTRARKEGPGVAQFKMEAKLSTSVLVSGPFSLPTIYQTMPYVLETKPGGGGWSKTDAQNLVIGFKSV